MLSDEQIQEMQEQLRQQARREVVAEMMVGGAAAVIHPGDKVIVRVPAGTPQAAGRQLHGMCCALFASPDDFLILSDDLQLFVLRRPPEEAAQIARAEVAGAFAAAGGGSLGRPD